MLKIATKTDEGRWITYAPGVEFKIRPLTSSKIRAIRKVATAVSMQLDPDTRKMVPLESLDNEKFDAAMADYLIEDFKGIGDSDGTPFQVTTEAKRLILDQLQLRDFIWASAQALDITEDATKNL